MGAHDGKVAVVAGAGQEVGFGVSRQLLVEGVDGGMLPGVLYEAGLRTIKDLL